jgi:hypothetical protein
LPISFDGRPACRVDPGVWRDHEVASAGNGRLPKTAGATPLLLTDGLAMIASGKTHGKIVIQISGQAGHLLNSHPTAGCRPEMADMAVPPGNQPSGHPSCRVVDLPIPDIPLELQRVNAA